MPMLGAPAQWDAATLRDAFERRSKEIPGSASLLATIMRSYLRLLIGRGQCRPALLHAMPSVRRYRLSALPRYIDPATIDRRSAEHTSELQSLMRNSYAVFCSTKTHAIHHPTHPTHTTQQSAPNP